MIRSFLIVLFVAHASRSQATEPCSVAAPAVTIAPFAIPVAVPVAVVQQPTLFYGYGRYVPTAMPATTAVTPANTVPAAAADPAVSISALLKKHCAECHQGPTARGGLQLFAVDGVPLALLPRQALAEACAPADGSTPTMPPAGRTPLTSEEQSLVRRWAVPPKTLRY